MDYTCGEAMEPSNVLAQQINMAPEYLANYWPKAISQAQWFKPRRSEISHILIGGCGDSHHAALGLELAFGTYSGHPTSVMEAMRLARYAPSLYGAEPETSLVIGISASGEVARTIEALEIWQELGAQTVAFTTNPDSSLARIAEQTLILPPPDIAHGPGLLSYLGSLLLGYASVVSMLEGPEQQRLEDLILQLPDQIFEWAGREKARAEEYAHTLTDGIPVFLGSGSAHGSARFGAAKVMEAAGERCWAQDVEEWAHLEYFCEPAEMSTILLSADGRSLSRENELLEAMKALGRNVFVSKWMAGKHWSVLEREIFSPLTLWVAPSAYASERATILAEVPFRDFRGGRDRKEGGGASRIRSSQRLGLRELIPFKNERK